MSIAIAITTAPRPSETLQRSHASLRAAGFEQHVRILSDGPSVRLPPPSVPCWDSFIINDPPLGGLRNWCQALEALLKDGDARWLMVCEDDVLWAPGAAQALQRDLKRLDRICRSSVGYLSLYLSRKVSKGIERRRGGRRLRPGMYTTDLAGGCWGSQVYVIPRETASQLLLNPWFDDKRRNYAKNRNRDNLVSECLDAMGKRLYYRVPCLVNHELGSANSSLSLKPVQQQLLTDYWTGKT